jgi:hypothetical protein
VECFASERDQPERRPLVNPKGLVVAGPVVVLTGDWVRAVLQAVQLAARRRGLDGLPPSADYGQLAEALNCALAADGREPVADQPEPAQWVSTRQAAHKLGCSERQARRVAARVGHRVGGRWVIPADALEGFKDAV